MNHKKLYSHRRVKIKGKESDILVFSWVKGVIE